MDSLQYQCDTSQIEGPKLASEIHFGSHLHMCCFWFTMIFCSLHLGSFEGFHAEKKVGFMFLCSFGFLFLYLGLWWYDFKDDGMHHANLTPQTKHMNYVQKHL